ncbi:SRPBCC family protein [Lysobacter korlensis]|uniref:SRPBCC family protein n=1 Tax=Lysobacter korlensis TaxID=553636 RepID=A0ABV6RPB7_9GAMM
MTEAFSASTNVAAPPERVWATITDWSRAPEWMPGTSSFRLEGPLRPGTVLHYTARGKERTSTVTAVAPERSLTLASTVGKVHAAYTYVLTPAAGGTRVDLTADVRTSGAMRLLARVIRAAIAKADSGQLDRLKRLIESLHPA